MAVMIQSVYGVHTVVQGVSPAALSAASVQAEDPFYPSEGPHGFCSYLKVHEMQIKYAFVC